MSIPLARRLTRRGHQPPTTPADPLAGGPRIFLTLAGEGELAVDQRSLPRRAFIAFVAVLVLISAPLYWVATAQGADQGAPQAVLAKSDEDDGEDDDGEDDDGDGDDTTGTETTGNTDQPGLETGTNTQGETDPGDNTGGTETGQTTGAETRAANTDRAGLENGASTRGETDPGDNTGQTERRR